MIKVVVFDFDDTLVRGTEWKKQTAFWSIFCDIPGAEDKARAFTIEHPGTGRLDMITGILAELERFGILDGPASAEYYLARYTKAAEDLQSAAPATPGAEKALDDLVRAGILVALNSATPQEAIERVLEIRGWRHKFAAVCGAPPGTKMENLGKILALLGVQGHETAVVGDGQSDLDAAMRHDCRFVAIRGGLSRFGRKDMMILDDLNGLLTALD
ncbi:MAG: HAD family hydrolase [Candidatus Sungbacteria bacterium]|nr:HAD family hydrolase [Candidatus Sungbacteria bacterium]